ncbi:MAG: SGNH/GDSL hydrolase family protein [Streptosporangiaceae bacterium]
MRRPGRAGDREAGRVRRTVTGIAAAVACALAAGLAAGCSGAPDPAVAASGQPGHSHSRGASARAARTRIRHNSYYLALGDSLAQGVQPDRAGADVPTRQGYPDQLYAALHRSEPWLRLVKLGCSGETTVTMIRGGKCRYPAGSQLSQATSFLRAHRGRIALITLDIGANDPNACLLDTPLARISACLPRWFTAALGNLAVILRQLRAAAGPQTMIIGMNYYVPELGAWVAGWPGRAVATLSQQLVSGYDQQLDQVYRRYGARVANVYAAFRSGDSTGQVRLPGLGTMPPNVAAICRWTWVCTGPHRPDEHANRAGYAVIAGEFLRAARS